MAPINRIASLRTAVSVLLLALVPSFAWAAPKIAVFPWKVNAPEGLEYLRAAMGDMLQTRLASNGAFEVVGDAPVEEAVAGLKPGEFTVETATDIGTKLNADYVLFGSLTVIGSSVSMDAQLVTVRDGSTTPFSYTGGSVDSVITLANKLASDCASTVTAGVAAGPVKAIEGETAAPGTAPAPAVPAPAPVTVAPVPAPVAPAPGKEEGFIVKPEEKPEEKPLLWKSSSLDGLYHGIVGADLDKDGVKEFFLIKENSLVIARKTPGGLGIVKEIKDRARNVSVTALDSDGDGAPEVYVSRLLDGRAYSSVVEFKEGDYRTTVTGVKWLLRTVNTPDGAVLAGQGFRPSDGFFGELKVLKKEGNAITDKGVFEKTLPGGADLYCYEPFAYKDGANGAAVLGKDGSLRLYKKSGEKWEEAHRTGEAYGGSLNLIDMDGGDQSSAVKEPLRVDRAIHSVGLDKDGRPVFMVKMNTPAGLGRYATLPRAFKAGALIALTIDDSGALKELWRTREVKDYIADFTVVDTDNDGAEELTLLIADGTGLLAGTIKSYILSYRFSI